MPTGYTLAHFMPFPHSTEYPHFTCIISGKTCKKFSDNLPPFLRYYFVCHYFNRIFQRGMRTFYTMRFLLPACDAVMELRYFLLTDYLCWENIFLCCIKAK